MQQHLSHLQELESESIHIIRETWSEFKNPVLLYSIGKDSSVLVRLIQKAFHPAKIPVPFMHIDTGYKFPEMYEFRDNLCKELGVKLIVHSNKEQIGKANPFDLGMDKCCKYLKTDALLEGLKIHEFDASFGGARRDEEKSRAKERVYSVRDKHGQWNPKLQRPELWDLYNSHIEDGEHVRIFPISNWTELDVWEYIRQESIPLVSLYLAKTRGVTHGFGDLYMGEGHKGEKINVECRFRSLGCMSCTGAVKSPAKKVDEIIE